MINMASLHKAIYRSAASIKPYIKLLHQKYILLKLYSMHFFLTLSLPNANLTKPKKALNPELSNET